MMDARQAVREAMMAERKAGHWADPSVDDDRHDETSLFGRGETPTTRMWNNRTIQRSPLMCRWHVGGFFNSR